MSIDLPDGSTGSREHTCARLRELRQDFRAKDSYFPVLPGSYCLKCRKQIMRDRHHRLNKGIDPYRVIKPIPLWQVSMFFGGLGFTLAFLVIIEAYYD